jgi:DNA-binding response OmpR family regulator
MARILIIDYDVQIRRMLRQGLERAGYEVVDVPEGNIAMRRHRQKPVDLIIIELINPEKEGIETIMELRRDYPEVKVIAISGGGLIGPEDYLRAAKALGAHRTFAKPLRQKEIIDTVRELLGDR